MMIRQVVFQSCVISVLAVAASDVIPSLCTEYYTVIFVLASTFAWKNKQGFRAGCDIAQRLCRIV